MNILFLTIAMQKTKDPGMYEALLRECIKNGHTVYAATAVEKRTGLKTNLSSYNNINYLEIATGNITGNVGIVEKGLSTISVDNIFKKEISKYFSGVKFDLVIYPTPPITLVETISWIKKRDNAKTYLLLKDIFPQNAVDLGMMRKDGVKGLLYKYFRKKEKKLYRISDHIGCMSPANVKYVIEHNPEVNPAIVEVCPNCVIPSDMSVTNEQITTVRKKYGVPLDKKVFVYGGNLGRPQGIKFVLQCIEECRDVADAFFLIVGGGSEAGKIKTFIREHGIENAMLIDTLPKLDYQQLANGCDVGLVFLDYRFTIPNFPSRLLSYMNASMPVLVATDPNTDMGDIVEENGFGWKCLSNDTKAFRNCIEKALIADTEKMGKIGREYMEEYFTVQKGYEIIIKHFY